VVAGSQGRARAGVLRSLRRYGISEEFALELIDAACAHTLPLLPRAGLAQAVRTTLVQRIPVLAPMPARGAAMIVVGSGGAGKTTVCATLLEAYRAESTLPASYATLIRRHDAEEMSILLAPHITRPTRATAVRSQSALAKVRGEGLAILDTPSLSPADRTGASALSALVAEVRPERVVVALPATLGAAPAAQLLEVLAPLGANSLAVTHAEETDQIGVAVEAACRHGVAPEYLLDRAPSGGWRLQRADPTELAARILP
jgi:flagellar biosynthesis GTPase FlhF